MIRHPRRAGAPVLVALLLGAVATLAPLAYASPPDPGWIAGLWDDADHDDVICRITSADGTVVPQLTSDGAPLRVVVRVVPSCDDRPFVATARSSSMPRAPPISSRVPLERHTA